MDTLLDRFCRYVKVETTSVEDTKDYPSSKGQLELGTMLGEEMKALGLQDVGHHDGGIVMGTIPGNVDGAPTIAWLAHQDTSPEAPGKDVKPNIIRNYDGKDVVLPGDTSKVIKVEEFPQLKELKGKTIITSDGTTLLGADDKAGIAVIMTAADYLMKNPAVRHGPIRVAFTCDEEVGRGTDKVDLKKLDATVGYTLDGEDEAGIENETFSADMATVKFTGFNIHPGFGYGKMINAIRMAGEFLAKLPRERAPETTKERTGFLHPYVLHQSGVDSSKVQILLRSFVTDELAEQAEVVRGIARQVEASFPKGKVEVEVKKQYRNMIEHLEKEPRSVKLAEQAIKNAGLTPKFQSIVAAPTARD